MIQLQKLIYQLTKNSKNGGCVILYNTSKMRETIFSNSLIYIIILYKGIYRIFTTPYKHSDNGTYRTSKK